MKIIIVAAAIIFSLAMIAPYAYSQAVESPGVTFSPLTNILNKLDFRVNREDRQPTRFTEFLNDDTYSQSGEDPYIGTPVEKTGDGLINVATFWTDVPRQMIRTTEEEDSMLIGYTWGFGKGVLAGFTRGAAGVVDTATLGTLPPEDKPLMKPAYKVDNPNEEFKIKLVRW